MCHECLGSRHPSTLCWMESVTTLVEAQVCWVCARTCYTVTEWDSSFDLHTVLLAYWWRQIVTLICTLSCWPSGEGIALRVTDQGLNSCLLIGDFSISSHTSDRKIGTPVATLPGIWCYRLSTSLTVQLQLSEQIHPCDILACSWDIKQPTNSWFASSISVLQHWKLSDQMSAWDTFIVVLLWCN